MGVEADQLTGALGADPDQLRISGLTGVDIALEIAGPGSRSYAFVIDWHIRFLLALAWGFAAWMLIGGLSAVTPVVNSRPREFLFVSLLPSIGIYVLYHPVLEILMRGRTPGKRAAGVRIVTRGGGTPSTGALLIRNVLRLLDGMPAFYLVGLITCFVTAQRVRIGDLAAGTLLVRDSGDAGASLARVGSTLVQSGLPSDVVELIHELLERWSQLASQERCTVARTILSRTAPSLSAAQLAGFGDHELSQRLRALLSASGGNTR